MHVHVNLQQWEHVGYLLIVPTPAAYVELVAVQLLSWIANYIIIVVVTKMENDWIDYSYTAILIG